MIIDGFLKNAREMVVGEVSEHRGRVLAHIRIMFPSAEAEGEWLHGRGVAIEAARFHEIRDAVHALFDVAGQRVVAKLQDGRDEIWVGIDKFRGSQLAFVRRYYQRDGEWLPSPRGVTVKVEKLSELCDLADRIAEEAAKS